MIRKIVKIDEEKCNGCGLCAKACHEGAIGMVDGKARLLRDDYCDGLGDCLPVCPVDAISFEEREAVAYDEAAVKANKTRNAAAPVRGDNGGADHGHGHGYGNGQEHGHEHEHGHGHGGGCMSTAFNGAIDRSEPAAPCSCQTRAGDDDIPSALTHWPVQIKLAPVNAPYFDGAELLIAADCAAYSCGDFHRRFMAGRITLIGCPKLDMVDYTEKLAEILRSNDIRSVTVARMVVPCCGGIQFAVQQAAADSGKDIPVKIVTIGIDGSLL